jgi:hypothetical protein
MIKEYDDNISSICPDCTTKLIDNVPVSELLPLVKIGIIAVIDEVTDYQDARMQREGELMRLFKLYGGGIK